MNDVTQSESQRHGTPEQAVADKRALLLLLIKLRASERFSCGRCSSHSSTSSSTHIQVVSCKVLRGTEHLSKNKVNQRKAIPNRHRDTVAY
jgi:hypothetical protein